ncbi:MAG: DedA family protein [Rhodospirillales bacterium]|nr:DedA family protein [Rhodospirillales bacterium]MSP80468.1 DedA family protein [Rhodospirillales bacterium]
MIEDQIAAFMNEYGDWFYFGIFVWTFFEGETIVIFGGYAAYDGIVDPIKLLFVAWFGSFLGDQVWFWLGRRYGETLLVRFPKWRPRVEVALDLLYEFKTLFILSFRFIYGIRNVSSFAVGLSEISWARYSVTNFIAAGLWATSFVSIGYLFGHVSEAALGKGAKAFGLGALLVFIVVVWLLLRRVKVRVAAHALKHPHPPLPAHPHPHAPAAGETREKTP